MEENNNVPVMAERTTAEVNAEYKSRAPKFHEKIDAGDTEDMVAFSRKRKPFTVSYIIISHQSTIISNELRN